MAKNSLQAEWEQSKPVKAKSLADEWNSASIMSEWDAATPVETIAKPPGLVGLAASMGLDYAKDKTADAIGEAVSDFKALQVMPTAVKNALMYEYPKAAAGVVQALEETGVRGSYIQRLLQKGKNYKGGELVPIIKPSLGERAAIRVGEHFTEKGKEAIPKDMSEAERQLYGATSSVAQFLPLAATGPAALPLIGAMAAGSKRTQMQAEGVPQDRALLSTAASGLIEPLTEKIPLSILMKRGLPIVKRMVASTLTDIPGEMVATTSELAIDEWAKNPEMAFDEFKKQILPALKDTVIQTAIAGPLQTAAIHPFVKSTPTEGREVDAAPPPPAPPTTEVQTTPVPEVVTTEVKEQTPEQATPEPGSVQKAFTAIKEFFSPGSTLPKGQDWLLERQKYQGAIDRGKAFAEQFVSRYKGLPKQDREAIWHFMDGQITVEQLPARLQNTAKRFRNIDNLLGKNLVDAKVISQETFLTNKDKHVKYIYDLYQKGHSPIGINTKSFTAREVLTDEYKAQIGLIKDPLQAVTQSILEGTKAVASAKYFTRISQAPEWTFQPSIIQVGNKKMGINKAKEILKLYDDIKDLTPPELARKTLLETSVKKAEAITGKASKNFVQLNGKKYGDLDGALVHHTVADDIKPMWIFEPASGEHVAAKTVNAIKQGVVTANSFWKMKNVALNIPAAFRNAVFSNPVQMNMSGTPLIKVPEYLYKGVKSYIAKDHYHRQALKQGAFKSSFSEGELNEIMAIAKNWEGTNIASAAEAISKLGKYYGKIDDIWKMAKFIEGKEKGMADGPAMREALKWHMDYSLVPPAIKTLRNIPLGSPYITYQYKVIPLIIESLAKRPWVIAKYALLPYALQQAITADMSDEDAEEFIASLPKHVRNGQVLLIPGSHGMNALDISYMLPWGNLWEIAMSEYSGEHGDAMRKIGLGTGLLPTVMYAAMMNRDLFTDEPIVSALGDHDRKTAAWELAKYTWRLAMPSMVTEIGVAGKIYEHERFGQTKRGLPTEWYNVYPRAAGVNIYPINPIAKKLEMRHDINEVRKALRKKMFDRNLTDDEKERIKEVYRFAVEDIREGGD